MSKTTNINKDDWFCSKCKIDCSAKISKCYKCGLPKIDYTNIINNSDIPTKKYYIVLDFEANCSGPNKRDHEIIEFPAVLVERESGKTISEFRKKLSEFIKELTHITDEQVGTGLYWQACLDEFEKWCKENQVSSENTTVITCGDWDLKTKLSSYLNALFKNWSNIKISFSSSFGYRKLYGMSIMLDELGLKLEGHHHSGIDDCRNIAKICHELTKRGTDVTQITSSRDSKLWYKKSY